MQTLLFITAPIIYIMIIAFSSWLGISSGRQRRGVNIQPLVAILAGLATCPLMSVLVQMGKLEIPSVDVTLPILCITLGVGFFVGLIYIWSAGLVFNGGDAVTSLFVLGTIAASTICLYFYFFYGQVQQVLISTGWGVLFGVLVYMVIKGRDSLPHLSR